ncbi:1,4-dihydroxy-2-naphthoate prenyltransferase [Rhodoblastus acidophilus]|uniref:1,4-dihydroxy-2-naphthoate octaprenyltransferase n=1 Tax=Rhodoblastus acidophilus TaxID=1074 RepID=A0A212R3I3_RHOAC|nr:1,4-dihydroxy-2-naphthoate polyprenyltransferase [Rhodoblastus acidophilus]PPQ40253.1 1,4-dihydroxy-2-naphthoate polyprenyltransferase [Rhodoblastus acidophilus]RAI19348.1 1,4-dihydroxy-2-naphthoate polyprenyltransferase [Rhodoblastus acidophilus]SNB66555.1 1,4-dihydroxy-2-naphthoate prenyltransferase [Rhodoblastus acidophilus]
MTITNSETAPLFSTWIGAMRPRTLTMALAPVLVGAALAWLVAGKTHLAATLVAMLSAGCIQIATNLFNDAKDFERGGDGPDRLGPVRAAASGLLEPAAIKRAAVGAFALAACGGVYLIAVGGWPILLLGLASIVSGWAYTGGPWPISYSPFGEIFVIAFFGLAAVCGTYWLCAGELALAPVLAGCAVGLFAAGVLMVNNFRDAAADARVGRRTLAIVAGPARARWLFAAMMLAPFALLAPLAGAAPPNHMVVALGALPLAAMQARRLFVERPGPGLNGLLAQTAQTQALFSVLLCLGAVF